MIGLGAWEREREIKQIKKWDTNKRKRVIKQIKHKIQIKERLCKSKRDRKERKVDKEWAKTEYEI